MKQLQKLYLICAISYIIYFVFITSKYKYKTIDSSSTTTIIITIIITIIMSVFFSIFVLGSGNNIESVGQGNDFLNSKKIDLKLDPELSPVAEIVGGSDSYSNDDLLGIFEKSLSPDYEAGNPIDKEKTFNLYDKILDLSVYFINFNISLILIIILVLLGINKKNLSKENLKNIDKNLFFDEMNKQIKYTWIFVIIFILITLFSFKEIKNIIHIIKPDGNILIFGVAYIALIIILPFIMHKKFNFSNIFLSDLNRCSPKDKPSKPPIPPKGAYICYHNKCENSKSTLKDFKKYKKFSNKPDCLNSFCEKKGNSGIIASQYNINPE